MTPMEQVRAKCKEVCAKALALYGVDLTPVRISFNLKGRAAGKAGGSRYRGVATDYYVKFNHDMLLREAFDHVLNATVAHEYAHVMCFMKPEMGKNHDSGWERICLALGGSGATRHKEEVVYGKGITYEYTTTHGHKVRLSERKHKHVQTLGGVINYRRNMGSVTRACAYSIVGHQGRTLANPIVKTPTAPAPAGFPNLRPLVITRMTPVQVAAAPKPADIGRVIGGFTVIPAVKPAPTAVFAAGQSKAGISRSIMLSGYRSGKTYEQIIDAMIAANGYDRQLARATFKANAPKVGIPSNWGG